MKKILFSFGIIFFMFVIGCEKDPNTDPIDPVDTTTPPPVVKYTITTEIISGDGEVDPFGVTEVDSGGGQTIRITPAPGFKDPDSIIVDGQKVPIFDNRYKFYPVLEDHDVKITFDTTLSWYLFGNGNRWKRDMVIEVQDDGDTIYAPSWGVPGSLQVEFEFFSDGTYKEYWDGEFVGDGGLWSIDETKSPATFRVGGYRFQILELNDENLSLKTQYVGFYWIEKFTHHN